MNRHTTVGVAVMTAFMLGGAAASTAPAHAQRGAAPESAIGTRLSDYGIFGGLDLRFGNMLDDDAIFMGAHAGLLLKQRVMVGVRGMGLVSDDIMVPVDGPAAAPLEAGYGGVFLGYVIPVSSMLELTAETLLAGGGIRLEDQPSTDEGWDAVFVFEPAVTAEVRLARILRLGIGAGYRWIGAVDTPPIRSSDLRGFTGSVTARVGWF
jgi:hypothetical protein